MMTVALRKAPCLGVKRILSVACSSVDTISHHRLPSGTSKGGLIRSKNNVSFGESRNFVSLVASETPLGSKGRDFHVKAVSLRFKESSVSQAEFAVDYSTFDNISKRSSGSSSDDGLEVSKLGISEEIVTALSKRGITKLFPIQKAVLEPAMEGRDMIGRARTGTGKTLAFGIPIIDKIIKFNAKHGRGKNPLCLVLAPTRELARQVEKEFSESAPSLDTICVYGGAPIGQQMRQLQYGVDIAVGTPGRIIDLINRGALNLSEVQFVVLDEADQMLQVGFAEDVEIILQNLPKNRQSMMFSATMPSWIRTLTKKYLKSPVTIDLVGDSDQKLADGITLYSLASDSYGKAAVIGPLITEHANGGKCIVFTQTKRDADQLSYAMSRSYKCEALHGDISQSQRERTLAGFRAGKFTILIATDVAARGLDVPNVDLVIHYELPNNTETFVHRTGRTGRAGNKGSAILIYTHQQARTVKQIEREVGSRFTELAKIAGDKDIDLSDMKSSSRTGSFGGSKSSGYGRSSSSGGSGYGRSGSSGGSGYGRSGSSGGGSGYGRSGSSGGGSGYGRSGSSGGGSGYGRSGSSGGGSGYGRSGSSGGGSGYGRSGSKSDRFDTFGDFVSGRSSGYGGKSSRTSGGYGKSRSSRFDSSDDE